MRVRVLGFQWTPGDGITVQQFLEFLDAEGPQGQTRKGILRQIYIQPATTTMRAGLVLAIRDHKRFLTSSQHGNTIRLVAQAVTGNNRLADCNFFVINAQSGRGLYAHYFQSLSLPQSQAILRPYYNDLKELLIGRAVDLWQTQNSGPASRWRRGRIAAGFKGTFTVETQLRGDTLGAMMDDLDEVSAFEFNYVKLLPNKQAFRPLKARAKLERAKVTFLPNVSTAHRKSAILSAVNGEGLQEGTIHGKDASGKPGSISLARNPDLFDEWSFDDFAGALDFTVDQLTTAEPIQWLLQTAQDNAAHF